MAALQPGLGILMTGMAGINVVTLRTRGAAATNLAGEAAGGGAGADGADGNTHLLATIQAMHASMAQSTAPKSRRRGKKWRPCDKNTAQNIAAMRTLMRRQSAEYDRLMAGE
jgi:hypothetical protein